MNKGTALTEALKERELEVLRLIAQGLSNTEIAEKLFISKETVRWYNKQLYSKLGTNRRTEAIARARHLGLLDGPTPQATPAALEEAAPARRPYNNLPTVNTPFLGRQEELATLMAMLAKAEHRLISIVAPGGMGKTCLAVQLGRQMLPHMPDGVVMVDLSPLRSPHLVLTTIADALKVQAKASSNVEQALHNCCREKRLLLILDNFEHVLESAPILSNLLHAAPQLKIVATSRERLNLHAETVYSLAGLQGAAHDLFLDTARRLLPDFSLAPEEQPILARIIQLLDGMPLALILAASWVEVLSIADIEQEIAHSLDFLSNEMRDMPRRQWSIRHIFDNTWKQLSEKEQQVWACCAIFRGSFSRGAAQAVAAADPRTLQSLLGKSLLQVTLEGRFVMHQLLRQYTYGILHSANLLDSTLQAYVDYYVQLGENSSSLSYMEWIETLELEQDNLRASLDWALAEGMSSTALRLLNVLSRFWIIQSNYEEALAYLQKGLALSPPEREQAALYRALGQLEGRLAQFPSAMANYQQALHLARQHQQRNLEAECLHGLAKLHFQQGKLAEAEPLVISSIQLSRQTGQSALLGAALVTLGAICEQRGDATTSILYYQEALDTFMQIDDWDGTARALYNLGQVRAAQGDFEAAMAHHEKSIALKRAIGDLGGIARRLNALGRIALTLKKYNIAEPYYLESLELCRTAGDPLRLLETLSGLGWLAFVQNKVPAAQRWFRQALEQAESAQHAPHLAQGQLLLAWASLSLSRPKDALPLLRKGAAAALAQDSAELLALAALALAAFFAQQPATDDAPLHAADLLALWQGQFTPLHDSAPVRLLLDQIQAALPPAAWAERQAAAPQWQVSELLRAKLALLPKALP